MRLKNWNRTLICEAKYLMDKKYYTIDSAMNKVWDKNYITIESSNKINIQELRALFWSKGFNELEKFNKNILRRYDDE